jgi:hypothetical protein
MARTKRNAIKPRNWVVSLMVENTKNTAFKDRKKEADKKKCREAVDYEREVSLYRT